MKILWSALLHRATIINHYIVHVHNVPTISEMEDAIEDIYTYAKSNCSGLDKVTFIISPPCDNNISKKGNICIKDALFQYISKISTFGLRMLILENLISRFENKNSRDLIENSSRRRIGVGKSPMSML